MHRLRVILNANHKAVISLHNCLNNSIGSLGNNFEVLSEIFDCLMMPDAVYSDYVVV